jgi:hypothetical protein
MWSALWCDAFRGASAPVDQDYWKCWQPLKREFDPNQRLPTKPAASASAAAPASK